MKKILAIFILIVYTLFAIYAQTVYTVETNSGTQEVVIPDGMTELDVLLYLAQSYYNLYDEHEVLKGKTEALTSTIEGYVDSNRELRVQYNEILSKYSLLETSYKSLNSSLKYRGLFGVGLNFTDNLLFSDVRVDFGVLLFQKVGVLSNLGITLQNPCKVTYGIGVVIAL